MKLSEMNTRELKTALCTITAPIASIAQSQEVAEVVKRLQNEKNSNKNARPFSFLLTEMIPLLMGKFEKETTLILSALTGKTSEEIDAQIATQTIVDIKESVDGVLIGFFKLFGPLARE